MDKENVVYIYIYKKMEYFPTIEKKHIMLFATTWMNLEGIMLREISQREEDKYCVISLICGI